jgi:crotonobetainyl-CoA:carnitine CoA-transferase CaiB-like acyl-CoA transferase
VNHGAPYGIYEARDGAIAISVFGDVSMVKRLADSIGAANSLPLGLTDADLFTQRDAIAAAFGRRIRQMSVAEATECLTAAGAWVAPLRSLEQALADPAVTETGLLREYTASFVGRHRIVTEPLHMSATPLQRDRPAPGHGEHTLEVLKELGYDDRSARTLLRFKGGDGSDQ